MINKLNINNVAKYSKTKLFRSFLAISGAFIMSTNFTSCSENNKPKVLFQDTMLEGTVVASVDGKTEILKVTPLTYKDKHIVVDIQKEKENSHKHYVNITTGEWLADSDGNCYQLQLGAKDGMPGYETINPRNADITDIESISHYLTNDELKKAQEGSFTNDDAVNVISRIKDNTSEKQKIK